MSSTTSDEGRASKRADRNNATLLADFTAYCRTYPSMRFWQALANWSGARRVEVVLPEGDNGGGMYHDTYESIRRDA